MLLAILDFSFYTDRTFCRACTLSYALNKMRVLGQKTRGRWGVKPTPPPTLPSLRVNLKKNCQRENIEGQYVGQKKI